MEKATRESWLSHIDAWKESGLNQAEFCRREGFVENAVAFFDIPRS